MGWLGLKKRPGRKDEEDQHQPQPLLPLTPVLNLLVPDIAGVTSFRLRQFFDVEEAEDYVQSLPSISGLHAFWGLDEPPPGHREGEGTGEAMVLIRSAEESDTVYVVSFVNLDSALSFARFEVKRGMSLGLLLIYWAEIVEVEANEQGIRLSPGAPPLPGFGSRRFAQEHWAQAAAEAAGEVLPVAAAEPIPVAQAPAVNAIIEEPEPTVIEETEAEATQAPEPELSWETEISETFEKETEEEFEQFVAEQGELRAAEQPAAEAQTEASAEIEEEAPEPEAVSIEEPEPVAAEPEAETRTQEEIDIEREAIAFLKASANSKKAALEPETAPHVVAESAPAPEAAFEGVAAPQPESAPEPPAVPPEPEAAVPEHAEAPDAVPVRAQVSVPVHHDHESEEELTEDLVEEVEKILKVKRWDKRESPFRGFDSPPGRF